MKTKLFKSFMAMLAIATAFAFVGCSEDDTDSTAVDPQIEISVSNLAFTQAEESKTVDVTSNSEWKAEVPADASWLTVTPTSGNGNKTVSVAVAANATGAARSAVVKFSAMHPTYGAWDNKTLTISQSAGDQQIEELETIFNDNFDKVVAEKDGNYWPNFDAKYANPQGSAASGVTYSASDNISVRANSTSDSDYSDYDGSGNNNIFFGKTPNKFVIENIALPADKDCYVLTFGGEKYNKDNGSVFDNKEFHVYVSGDNTKWSEVTYAFEEGDNIEGRWNDATASFKFTATPEKLYIKFVVDVASSYRLDDVTLATGGEGAQTIDLSQGTEENPEQGGDEPSTTKEVTVTEAIKTENGTAVKVKESTVVAVSAKSYLLTDGTSYILAYKGDDPGLAVGDKVTVEGSIGAYRSVPQIANPVATKTGHDDSFKHPEATVIDGAAADAFLTSTYIKYVKMEGKLAKSGTYWNLAIEGATKAQGSVSYPTAEMCPDSNDGKQVAVYGYTLYQTRDTDVNVIATSIEVIGESEGGEDDGEDDGGNVASGDYTSLACFLPKADDNDNKSYIQKANIAGAEYSVLKLGTSSVIGTFTSSEVGVSGNKTLGFYAVAWKGKKGTLKISVDGTEAGSFELKSNDGATGNPPYTLTLADSDYYTVKLSGLKENSKVTFSTESGATRVIACGIKFTDGSGSVEGGDEPDVPEVKEMTIAEVIAAEKDTEFKLKESTVVAISKKGLMLYDGANYIYAYAGKQPEVTVGDKVTVEGKKGTYNNMAQISNPVVTKIGTDASFAHPTVVEMNGAAIDAFQNDIKIQYVKVAGKLAISGGKYFNLAVEGATVQGSLDNPLDAICPADYDGKDLVVYGYTLYTSSSNKYVNIITTAVEVVEPTPGEGEGGDNNDNEDLPLAPSTEWDYVIGNYTKEDWKSPYHLTDMEYYGGAARTLGYYSKLYGVYKADELTNNDGKHMGTPVGGQRYAICYSYWNFICFNIGTEEIDPQTMKPKSGTGCYALIDVIDRPTSIDKILENYSYYNKTEGAFYVCFKLRGIYDMVDPENGNYELKEGKSDRKHGGKLHTRVDF